MWRDVPALVCAGLLAALIELAWTFAFGQRLFLGQSERLGYLSLAATAIPVLVAASGAVLRFVLTRPRLWNAAAGLTFLSAGALAYLLTEGRRVKDLALRPVLVLGFALLLAFLVRELLSRIAAAQHSARGKQAVVAIAIAVGVVLMAVDAKVLVRNYPAFHVALSLLSLSSLSLSYGLFTRPLSARVGALCLALLAALAVAAPFSALHLKAQPNASYVVESVAPWSGKLLVLAGRARARTKTAAEAKPSLQHGKAAQARGIDLRDQDILLITVDAMRADLLSAYGGTGLTPALDALGREGLVFRRAYTAAPHTSYSLSSLLTAKFLKPVLEIEGASNDPPTLPDLLRRYGYRTAAFYPPAIFFVDGSRFEALRERGFGFEYRKEMYAPAAMRVQQVKAYFEQAEKGKPVFAWVHLFEPHEPYDPPAELVREDSARGRYEAEVVSCDRAIGTMVKELRALRPGATVIVSADHGEEFGDHGGHYHGTTLFDEQVRIPLVWSSPGKVPAGVTDAPVELVDVGTSVLSAAGVPREARMRGDDLGGLLSGDLTAAPPFAFAAVEDKHMVTDGHLKAICAAHEQHCQLFDLDQDPRELRNLAGDRPADVQRLRAALDAFLASIPAVEAVAVDDGVAFPAALARARLGAPGAGPDVIPLLADARPRVRLAAARTLGELAVAASAMALDRLRANDPDEEVRAEAAVASLLLGTEAALPDVLILLSSEAKGEGLSLARRAALALSLSHRVEALPVLSELAHDERADELDRLRAVKGLAGLKDKAAATALIDLLSHVRLRVSVAEALGEIGGKPAANAIAKLLKDERYQPARRAEARALQRMGDRRTASLVTRMLGMETSIPDGVRILMELGLLKAPKASGALLSSESVRKGSWECSAEACSPGKDAQIELPAGRVGGAEVRVTLLLKGEVGSSLVVDGVPFKLKAAEEQVSMLRTSRDAQRMQLQETRSVQVIAVVVVPAQPEIPAPPPEPWEAEKSAEGAPPAGSVPEK